MYISSDVQDSWQPLDQHGRSRKIAIDGGSSWDASKDEMGPNGYPTEFCNDARKFDSGGKPNPILLPILRASLEQVVELDVVKAQEDLKLLIQPITRLGLAEWFCSNAGATCWSLDWNSTWC